MHLCHIDRILSPEPELVLQHRLAPLVIANCSDTFGASDPSPLVPSYPPCEELVSELLYSTLRNLIRFLPVPLVSIT